MKRRTEYFSDSRDRGRVGFRPFRTGLVLRCGLDFADRVRHCRITQAETARSDSSGLDAYLSLLYRRDVRSLAGVENAGRV